MSRKTRVRRRSVPRPYDTGRDDLNATLDALSKWWDGGADDDGEPLSDGDDYELLMMLVTDVLEASDRPMGTD